jgi:hypothetical protein
MSDNNSLDIIMDDLMEITLAVSMILLLIAIVFMGYSINLVDWLYIMAIIVIVNKLNVLNKKIKRD